MKVAALDLGTNSFLCLILEKKKNQHSFKVLEDEITIPRLGEGVSSKDPKLTRESLQRAEASFQKYRKLLDKHSVDSVKGLATAAARECKNFSELVDIGLKYKIPIALASPEKEAFLSFKGSVPTSDEESSLVVDIGGGSTELAFVTDGKFKFSSLPLGAVRLGQMVVKNFSTLDESHLDKISDQVFKSLSVVFKDKSLARKGWHSVGGTATSLKAIELGGFEALRVHNSVLTLQSIKEINMMLMGLSLEDRKKVPGLSEKRADVIPVGTQILISLMQWFGIGQVKVSTGGLRYGLAYEMFDS